MREWVWSPSGLLDLPISVPLLLLALMLFSAALLTDLSQIRNVLHQPGVLCIALVAVWLGPSLLVFAAGQIVPEVLAEDTSTGLLVGLALVATMPVANSSVGWTQAANGSLALALALVVLSISLSPLVAPQLLNVLGASLSPSEEAYCEALVNRFSGMFFILWVLLPTAAGFAFRMLLRGPRLANIANWWMLASAAALLLLNYINSALALPQVYDAPVTLLATTAALAAGLSAVGLLTAWLMARLMRLTDATRSALLFTLSMKHTGLALMLAGVVLANQPTAILLIVLATLMQHLVAAAMQWFMHTQHN